MAYSVAMPEWPPEDLEALTEHLLYETQMLSFLSERLGVEHLVEDRYWEEHNALIESFVIHARGLRDFLWKDTVGLERVIGRAHALLEQVDGDRLGPGHGRLRSARRAGGDRASLRLVHRCRFREVGLHRYHGRLEGTWRDVLLVERLLGDAARAADEHPPESEHHRSLRRAHPQPSAVLEPSRA